MDYFRKKRDSKLDDYSSQNFESTPLPRQGMESSRTTSRGKPNSDYNKSGLSPTRSLTMLQQKLGIKTKVVSKMNMQWQAQQSDNRSMSSLDQSAAEEETVQPQITRIETASRRSSLSPSPSKLSNFNQALKRIRDNSQLSRKSSDSSGGSLRRSLTAVVQPTDTKIVLLSEQQRNIRLLKPTHTSKGLSQSMREKPRLGITEGVVSGDFSGRDNLADKRVALADQPISEEELESLQSAVLDSSKDGATAPFNIYPQLTANELEQEVDVPSVEAIKGYFDPKYCRTTEETVVFFSPINAIFGNDLDKFTIENDVSVAQSDTVTSKLVPTETETETELQGSVLDQMIDDSQQDQMDMTYDAKTRPGIEEVQVEMTLTYDAKQKPWNIEEQKLSKNNLIDEAAQKYQTKPDESPRNDMQVKNAFATLEHQDDAPVSTNMTTAVGLGTMAAMKTSIEHQHQDEPPSNVEMEVQMETGEASINQRLSFLTNNANNQNQDSGKSLSGSRNDSEVILGASRSNFDDDDQSAHKTVNTVASRLEKLRAVTNALSFQPVLQERLQERSSSQTLGQQNSTRHSKRGVGPKQGVPNIQIKSSLGGPLLSQESFNAIVEESKQRHSRDVIIKMKQANKQSSFSLHGMKIATQRYEKDRRQLSQAFNAFLNKKIMNLRSKSMVGESLAGGSQEFAADFQPMVKNSMVDESLAGGKQEFAADFIPMVKPKHFELPSQRSVATPLRKVPMKRQREISPEVNYLNTIVRAGTSNNNYENYRDAKASAASQIAIEQLRKKRMERLNIVVGESDMLPSLDTTTLNTIDKRVKTSKQETRINNLNDRINMTRLKLSKDRQKLSMDQKELRDMQIQKYRYESNLRQSRLKGQQSMSSLDPANGRRPLN